ncbi:hypothetical protein AVEN_251078-1 [Araneus ventricosus]|uniref:Uncharacterized protein n=1 Tax=Araneus ventricosus TaxID=182803 RepID=A0A4Y2WKH2_ARAVE|nr:hypothetical protein AVEN_251078-1 [Araneus ventricosus]
MGKDSLFDRVFGENRSDGDRLIDDDEFSLASFVYDVAYDEIYTGGEKPGYEPDDCDFDTVSVISFEEKIEAAMVKFDRVVEVFKKSHQSKESFLKSFGHWAQLCKNSIQSLRVFASEMQTDKFNSDIARVVGGVVGAIGGELFMFPRKSNLT